MRNNINNWKVINNKLPIFVLFCFVWVLYLGIRISYWYFLIFLIVIVLSKNIKINTYQITILIFIYFVFTLLIWFAWEFGLVDLYKNYSVGYVRQEIFKFFDNNYTQEVSSFIKLILFNVKSKETFIFYKQTVDLGIVWLFCISGFHISFLSRIIKWCFKKKPIIGRYVNISIVLFYSYLLNFSYASLRVLLKLCFEKMFYKFKTKKFDQIGIVGLVICFTNPCCMKDYGFILSFLIWIGANSLDKLDLNSKILKKIIINILAFIITIPFVIKMNNKISLFTFINAFIFNFFSPWIFLYFLLFAWFPFMQVVHHGILIGVYAIIGNISYSNIFIYCKEWQSYIIAIYYIIIFLLFKIIYLIVYNNKI